METIYQMLRIEFMQVPGEAGGERIVWLRACLSLLGLCRASAERVEEEGGQTKTSSTPHKAGIQNDEG